MFDQLDNSEPHESKKRKNLPFWGMLLTWLVTTLSLASYNWFLENQDLRIAPKEQVALGSVYKSTQGRGGPHVYYSFSFHGKEYDGNDGVPYPSIITEHVAVYFDPDNPTINNLTEYRSKSQHDYGLMIACDYASAGLAVMLAFALWIRRSTKKPEHSASHFHTGERVDR